ncbi:hypothetical protein P879_09128 [Paragonimus westermani]|uniref:Xaa-Pro aminopeptidase n=1 Tax=Paragonimus westermani TaxID=34504 RepID=A0A8T0D1V3_9TREM|nr:hypothetical protein P879_09128 [Paragonimus westermani]
MKAVKNPSELEGIRQAHLVDSLVLCDYLAWLDEIAEQNRASNANSGSMRGDLCDAAGLPSLPAPEHLTEASAATYLDALRLQSTNCIGHSFATISGADGNSSVIHYHPTIEKCAPLTTSSLYLVDSGGQYQTGTTDVTRTVHLHQPTPEQKACYTLVLKAHIAVSSQVFPRGTTGSRLDMLARHELWNHQTDFAHGTGHGVGAFLCVHEGPIGLSGSRVGDLTLLGLPEPGIEKNMVVTIEPGYYVDNQFGIRLENVVFVINASPRTSKRHIPHCSASGTEWLTFEPVTLVPFQRRMIDRSMLSTNDLNWLNQYHAIVYESLKLQLLSELGRSKFDPDDLSTSRRRCWEWLVRETSPFA